MNYVTEIILVQALYNAAAKWGFPTDAPLSMRASSLAVGVISVIHIEWATK